jgi:UDP-N-acetylglucosamine 3-dehydrogenase
VTVRFAVVGCGTAANHIHLPALRAEDDVAISVFASRSRSSAEATRDAWGTGDVEDDWARAVERDDVDAVVIAAPNAQHHAVALAAMAAGKHVLVDKPMARTAAEADEMIAAAAGTGTVLVPFQNTRFAPAFVAAHDDVERGAIGAVTGVRAAFGHGGPQAWAPRATWFFERASSGGGCLIDLGVHVVDLVRFVTGDDIVAVSAMLNGAAGDVETDAQLVVRLASGAIGTIHASWSSRPGPDHQLTVVGTEGTLHLDARTPLTRFDLAGERERVALPSVTSSPLHEFLAAVRGERAPSVTAHDGRAAVAVVEAAYAAAESGRAVSVP